MSVRLGIPLVIEGLIEEGGCAIKKKMRSHRSGADWVVGIDEVFQNAFFGRGCILDHPVRFVKGGFATSS